MFTNKAARTRNSKWRAWKCTRLVQWPYHLCPVRYCNVTYIVTLLRYVELKKIMIFEKTIREDGVEVISLITVKLNTIKYLTDFATARYLQKAKLCENSSPVNYTCLKPYCHTAIVLQFVSKFRKIPPIRVLKNSPYVLRTDNSAF